MTDIFDFDDDKETMADEIFYDEEKEVSEDDFEDDDEGFEDGSRNSENMIRHRGTRMDFLDDEEEVSEELLTRTETSEDDFEEEFEEEEDFEEDTDEDRSGNMDLDSGKKEKEDKGKKDDDGADEYESVCFICRRPESVTGKQFKMPNHICVCNDCMHKTMDAVSQFDYQGMLSDPNLLNGLNKGSPISVLSI